MLRLLVTACAILPIIGACADGAFEGPAVGFGGTPSQGTAGSLAGGSGGSTAGNPPAAGNLGLGSAGSASSNSAPPAGGGSSAAGQSSIFNPGGAGGAAASPVDSGGVGGGGVAGGPAGNGGAAGTGNAGAAGSVPNVFDSPPVCTSMQTWPNGDSGSPLMHPGRACLACHRERAGAPSLVIAGTAYPTGHEPNECNGVGTNTGAVVVITDAANVEHRINVNAAGNFLLQNTNIALPYRAKVVVAGRERVMGTPQMNGDCNGCHTQSGANGAPGRIVIP